MVQEAQQPRVQFEKQGPAVYVRNTFLNFDAEPVSPKLPILQRGRSAPVADMAALAAEVKLAGQRSPSPAPPSPTELVRVRTYDPFEDALDSDEEGDVREQLPRVQTYDPYEMQWLSQQQQQPEVPSWGGAPMVAPVLLVPANCGAMPAMPNEWPGEQIQPEPPLPPPPAVDATGPWGGDVAADPQPREVPAAPTAMPQPQTLERSMGRDGVYRVSWTVDARKLSGSERVAVSPPFELSSPAPMTFKMMLLPKSSADRRGGASFRKSGGRGMVQLKCEAQTSEGFGGLITFRVASGCSTADALSKPPRKAVQHNFARNLVCIPSESQDDWDFRECVDEASQTFVVCLEVL